MYDEWHGLYGEGWGKSIVSEAFSHPAKFRPALIRHIYAHMFEEGWLRPGMTVLDPFAGVALGALHAMRNGLHWVGVELEPKFVALGQDNIALWDGRYMRLWAEWGSAVLIQGDSRELLAVLGNHVQGAVSSPPYTNSLHGQRGGIDWSKQNDRRDIAPHGYLGGGYGDEPAQLAEMREGDLAAAISSPPFEDAVGSDDPDKRGGLYRDPKRRGDRSLTGTYGETPGQLGTMKGGFEAAVSSPPFGAAETRDRTPYQDGHVGDMMGRAYTQDRQGETEGNLAQMETKAADLEAVVSSPPWQDVEGANAARKHKDPEAVAAARSAGYASGELRGHSASPEAILRQLKRENDYTYGDSPGQLGAERGETFWQAARTIIEQVYLALSPGAHAVWVTKAFVRKGKRVDFPGQWRQLCEAVGFVTLHEHHAMLIEDHGTQLGLLGEDRRLVKQRKSFFRQLAERKGSPSIDYEVVWCMERP